MSLADWGIIAIYGIGMLAVGRYYGRRTQTSEEYLLGSRRMNPIAVGLSLFATLLSTLSYLAYPGEMIRNGPLIFTGMIVFPLVYWLVGWWLIPSIMRRKVTSAYEILESELGPSVRMLGVFFFLSLRLLWMATIIHATVDKALLPIFGIDRAYLPLICVGMGIVTLSYTSMGGLRAVVFTDVIQTAILIVGAILTIVLISIHFGSCTTWVPNHWYEHWESVSFDPNPRDRFSVGNAMLMILVWYLCTAGSDQMAIQRYLATRDVKAARKTFGVSLITTFLVQTLLAFVGLALLAYFVDQPHMLPDGETIVTYTDRLFARFILLGLPMGMTGLVTAGLMAAAMSSLSSGMNSSCSVVSEDILRRFSSHETTDTHRMAQAKRASVWIGVLVILLSLSLGYVQGNLLDVTIRVVNLFVAPLFVLFFMALFVPWATSSGTIIGGLVSVAIAIAIAFFEVGSIDVPWIMPASLIGGIAVGVIASLFRMRPSINRPK